jgi:class 3 adenylate cyclase
VAEALMRGERVPPEKLAMISMFFSDIVGFTDLSSRLPAEKVGDMLDRLYLQFDSLAEAHGVFRLETIGDAYLCAANVAQDQAHCHAAALARFSRAAMRAAQSTLVDAEDPSLGCVRVRIGLHSGPCMASVVGTKYPKYTLLGDTVNTASRMESQSVPGRIQCSARTAELIQAQDPTIGLEARGEIEVKG